MKSEKPYWGKTAPQLVTLLPSLIPTIHINRGRDNKYVAEFMNMGGWDAIDVLWFASLYRETAGPYDVQRFIQWCRRIDLADIPERLEREVEVALCLDGEATSRQVAAHNMRGYWACIEGAAPSAKIEAARRQYQARLEAYIVDILGERPHGG